MLWGEIKAHEIQLSCLSFVKPNIWSDTTNPSGFDEPLNVSEARSSGILQRYAGISGLCAATVCFVVFAKRHEESKWQ